MASVPRTRVGLTLGEFLRLPEEKPALEYIDGRIEPKDSPLSPQRLHSAIQTELAACLNQFARPAGLGRAFVELRCTFAGRSIVPDVVFQLPEHIPVDARGRFTNESTIPPDIHIEVISPKQGLRKAREKLTHATVHGCPLGWLIDPERDIVEVYRAGRPPERLASDGFLDGEPVLPGFRLPVSEVFGWLMP